jgi:hypothetical protein
MASTPTLTPPALAAGISRQWPVPACSLTLADLRRLFDILKSKASEATNEQLSQPRLPSQTDADVRNAMDLVLRTQGTNGEWSVANSTAPITDDSAPALLTNVFYECGQLYRARYGGLFPQNSFTIALDFKRTRIGDLTNLALAEGLGSSTVSVTGMNSTWVNAVDLELRTFFRDRANRRGWLHSKFAYDLALVFLAFPLILDGIYKLDNRLSTLIKLPAAVFVALYVYLVLVGLYGFRIFFNYVKWVFPKIEGPPQRNKGAIVHKMILTAIGLALLTRIVTTILWFAGIQLH